MPRGGPNQKAVAAAEKKGAAQAVKDAEKARKAEAAIAADWSDPNIARSQARADSASAKADEVARKKREKEALLAAEEAANGSGGKAAKSKFGAATNKRGNNKKKDDLSLLTDALIGDAEKKAKDKKRLDRMKKEREAMASIDAERKAEEERARRDPLLANTDAMIGMMAEEGEGGGPSSAVGRAANVATMADVHASGVDAALSAMSLGGGGGGGGGDDRHPEKRMKAAYKAYEERMMPEMKSQYPGLKRQQYLDKIFASWKKSPENPLNQQ